MKYFESRKMPVSLSQADSTARLVGDLRIGVPVVIIGESGQALAVAADGLSADRLAELRTFGTPELAMTARRAETLKTPAYDGDLVRVTLPVEAGADWVQAMADPSKDMAVPMKGPFAAIRDGDASLHRAAIALVKRTKLLPAVVLVPVRSVPDHLLSARATDILSLEQVTDTSEIAAARVPLAIGESRVHVFRPPDGGEEHYAIEIGTPSRDKPVLSRLHSACFTGDLLGSLKCDCGAQLRTALAQMGAEGAGVLLYMNQEGRGIGLANKLRAYALQDQGFDTVEANHRLGFEDDERDFRLAADILRRLGFSAVRLMTNNPRKVEMMSGCGLTVTERVPLKVGETPENRDYLATKAAKSGHIL